MLRIPAEPRADWPRLVEAQGLAFHSIGGEPYWDESAYYLLEAAEIDRIEEATYRLDAMALEAVEYVIREGRLGELGIPEAFFPFVAQSWERDEHTIYGRFDLSYDGKGAPKLLEYNADTPTALLEASVIQWTWFQDLNRSVGPGLGRFDQFNSIHEKLIDAWTRVGRELGRQVAFAAVDDSVEDAMTAGYLRDTAIQAGLQTQSLSMTQVGWQPARGTFTDLRERPIPILFKLYPWEWMLAEPFARNLPRGSTRWLEPPWKMILSSKAILVILHELFPESPYLLRAGYEPMGDDHVIKPVHSREGANVAIVQRGEVVAETDGDYGDGPVIYQDLAPLPDFGGRFPVIGSWMVNGHACGLGIREDSTARSPGTPAGSSPTSSETPPPPPRPSFGKAGGSGPLWDRWLDR